MKFDERRNKEFPSLDGWIVRKTEDWNWNGEGKGGRGTGSGHERNRTISGKHINRIKEWVDKDSSCWHFRMEIIATTRTTDRQTDTFTQGHSKSTSHRPNPKECSWVGQKRWLSGWMRGNVFLWGTVARRALWNSRRFYFLCDGIDNNDDNNNNVTCYSTCEQ